METGIINGFVLWKKAFEQNDRVFVFPCCKKNVSKIAVSIFSLLENLNTELNYEIIIVSNGFDKIDSSRLYYMAHDYNNVKIRIAEINNFIKKSYIKVGAYLNFEDGILLFLPFVLKRYTDVIAVNCGTIFAKDFNVSETSENDMICYIGGESEVLAVQYNLEKCRDRISPKVIADVSREKYMDNIFEMLKEIYLNNFKMDCSNSVFLDAKSNGQFNTIFWEYAKKTCYYEKLLYDIMGSTEAKKQFLGEKYYLFPFERVKKGSNIVLYGAGKVGKQYSRQLLLSKYCNIVAIVDSKYEWYQKHGEQVQDISFLLKSQYDFVVIAIADETIVENVVKDLVSRGIEPKKLIIQAGRELEI